MDEFYNQFKKVSKKYQNILKTNFLIIFQNITNKVSKILKTGSHLMVIQKFSHIFPKPHSKNPKSPKPLLKSPQVKKNPSKLFTS